MPPSVIEPETFQRITAKETSVTTDESRPSPSDSVPTENLLRSSEMRWSGLSVAVCSSSSR